MAAHFLQDANDQEDKTEELKCEWKKFKYNLLQLKGEIPRDILHPPKIQNLISVTPTEWALHQMLSQRSTYQHFMPGLLQIAEVCLSLPISNAWPERGASAMKRLKTRLRSRIKNDMLQSLMHVSINGPSIGECQPLIKAAVEKWIPNRKKLAKDKSISKEATIPAAVVEVRLDGEPADTSDSEELNSAYEVLQVPLEAEGVTKADVESVIEALKLPKENDLDFDSNFCDFDSGEESDSELLW